MLPYHFNKIHTELVGEYENSLQIIFFPDEENHMLVYNSGVLSIKNKPSRLDLALYDPNNNKRSKQTTYSIIEIYDYWEEDHFVYLKLQNAIIKISWYFSTQSGQLIETYDFCDMLEDALLYQQWIKEMAIGNPMQISDLRSI